MNNLFKLKPTEEVKKAEKDTKLFDQIHALWDKSKVPDTNTALESVYMVNRFISLDPMGFWDASELNSIINLPEWCYAPLMHVRLPYSERKFCKYPKNLNPKRTESEIATVARICEKYCCSTYHGEQYVKLFIMQGVNVEVKR